MKFGKHWKEQCDKNNGRVHLCDFNLNKWDTPASHEYLEDLTSLFMSIERANNLKPTEVTLDLDHGFRFNGMKLSKYLCRLPNVLSIPFGEMFAYQKKKQYLPHGMYYMLRRMHEDIPKDGEVTWYNDKRLNDESFCHDLDVESLETAFSHVTSVSQYNMTNIGSTRVWLSNREDDKLNMHPGGSCYSRDSQYHVSAHVYSKCDDMYMLLTTSCDLSIDEGCFMDSQDLSRIIRGRAWVYIKDNYMFTNPWYGSALHSVEEKYLTDALLCGESEKWHIRPEVSITTIDFHECGSPVHVKLHEYYRGSYYDCRDSGKDITILMSDAYVKECLAKLELNEVVGLPEILGAFSYGESGKFTSTVLRLVINMRECISCKECYNEIDGLPGDNTLIYQRPLCSDCFVGGICCDNCGNYEAEDNIETVYYGSHRQNWCRYCYDTDAVICDFCGYAMHEGYINYTDIEGAPCCNDCFESHVHTCDACGETHTDTTSVNINIAHEKYTICGCVSCEETIIEDWLKERFTEPVSLVMDNTCMIRCNNCYDWEVTEICYYVGDDNALKYLDLLGNDYDQRHMQINKCSDCWDDVMDSKPHGVPVHRGKRAALLAHANQEHFNDVMQHLVINMFTYKGHYVLPNAYFGEHGRIKPLLDATQHCTPNQAAMAALKLSYAIDTDDHAWLLKDSGIIEIEQKLQQYCEGYTNDTRLLVTFFDLTSGRWYYVKHTDLTNELVMELLYAGVVLYRLGANYIGYTTERLIEVYTDAEMLHGANHAGRLQAAEFLENRGMHIGIPVQYINHEIEEVLHRMHRAYKQAQGNTNEETKVNEA